MEKNANRSAQERVLRAVSLSHLCRLAIVTGLCSSVAVGMLAAWMLML